MRGAAGSCPGLGRRSFLAGAVAAPILWALTGCKRRAAPAGMLAKAIKEVDAYHNARGSVPTDPIAVAWDPSVIAYPPIHAHELFAQEHNPVYALVARALMLLGPDDLENPLAGIIRPGDSVVIKPNWCTQVCFPFPITHPSVVFPLVEYAIKAGASRVTIVEAPMTLSRGCAWFWSGALVGVHELTRRIGERHGVDVRFVDGNDDEFLWIDVGEASELASYDLDALDHDGHTGFARNTFFDVADTNGVRPGRYRRGLYAIARSYLDCDVFINVPKLKTHGYTGLTVALKNLMGLNVRSTVHKMSPDRLKDYERRPDYAQWRESPMRDVPHFDRSHLSGVAGPWFGATPEDRYQLGFGNDVLWRTLADLNKIILYANKSGVMTSQRQRRYLAVVDGVVGTDRNGPISSSLVHSKCIIAGQDPVGVDAVAARVMGWDPAALNLVQNCARCERLPLGSAESYMDRIVGAAPYSPCFDTRFVPPDSYAVDIVAPHKLVRAS